VKSLSDWIPNALNEEKQLLALSADERRIIQERGFQDDVALAPYIAYACLIFMVTFIIVDIERYRANQLDFSVVGLFFWVALLCHIVVGASIVPALMLKWARFNQDRAAATRLLKLHQSLLIWALLVLAITAVIIHARFIRLAALLVLVNLIYVLPWRFRHTINGVSLVTSGVTIFLQPMMKIVLPIVAFGEVLTMVSLCALGGISIHRSRVQGYLAQYRESLYLSRLREEISVASQLQQSMLPDPWPASQMFAVHGLMRPAQDIGGDFYDHFAIQDGAVCMVIADVCGKGIPAGLFSMSAKSALHATTLQSSSLRIALDPGALVAGVNDLLNDGNKDMLFVTAIYALYEPSTGRFDFVNAGHVKPMLLSSDGQARWLDSPKGTALGARPNRRYAAAHLELQPGDTVLMITDGVTEALNDQFEEFGLDRVMAALNGSMISSARDCIDQLLAAVDTFTGGVEQSDDITCMAICHRPTDVCMAA